MAPRTPQHYRIQALKGTLSWVPIRPKRYTQRNPFEILLNQTEIRMYLPFSD